MLTSCVEKGGMRAVLELELIQSHMAQKTVLRVLRSYVGGLSSLAAHDERARKNGYNQKMRRIELVKHDADVVR